MTKRCSGCKATKDTTEFNRASRKKDGLQSYCRACSRKRAAGWAAQHPERVKAASRRHYERHRDTAEYQERRAVYRREHRPMQTIYDRRSRARDPERYRARKRAWRANNRDRVRAYAERHRLRLG